MLADLVPALILVVCTEGYNCSPQRHNDRVLLAQPSFEACLENLAGMPQQPRVFEEAQQFAVIAACALVAPEDLTD